VKLAPHMHLVPTYECVALYLDIPIYIYEVNGNFFLLLLSVFGYLAYPLATMQ
jgi:hypothetical protein